MRYSLKLKHLTVGHSDLEHRDASQRAARGAFRPGLGWDLIEPIFALEVEAYRAMTDGVPDESLLTRFLQARDALGLTLVDAHGRVVGCSDLRITSAERDGAETVLEIEAEIEDVQFWREVS